MATLALYSLNSRTCTAIKVCTLWQMKEFRPETIPSLINMNYSPEKLKALPNADAYL